jgi:Ran GTPase-activating protein (RanGAP) involved in mRNA processing and transport
VLKECHLESLGWLCEVASNLPLEVIALESCHVTDDILAPLAAMLATHPSITSVGLAQNFITIHGFSSIISSGRQSGRMSLIDMESNRIRLADAKPALAEELLNFNSLQHLTLADNPLGREQSFAAFMKCIPRNLRSLNLNMVRNFSPLLPITSR